MSDDNVRMLHNQLVTSQHKYIYFLLAVAASAIAFSTQATKDMELEYSLIPLGVAVLCWAFSFFCGCRTVQYDNSNTVANIDLLKVERGEHEECGNNPAYISAASQGIRQAYASNQAAQNRHSKWQFRFLVIGGILFIVWHILKMWLRTTGN